jgi:hypothetical protein
MIIPCYAAAALLGSVPAMPGRLGEKPVLALLDLPGPGAIAGEVVLFALDDRAFPKAEGVKKGLIAGKPLKTCIQPVPGFACVEEKAQKPPVLPWPYARVLMQGQGMYNVGRRTLLWHACWSGPDVRVAEWERDRLGYLEPGEGPSRLVTCPIRVAESEPKVYLNARTGEGGKLTVSVLSSDGRPLPGYAAVTVWGNHLRKPVRWPGGDALSPAHGEVRIQITGSGDWKLYALYVGDDARSGTR